MNRCAPLAVGVSLLALIGALVLATFSSRATGSVPPRVSDDAFWSMMSGFSEEGGGFAFENFVSNEITYQRVIPALKRTAKAGGAYLGVGPEQNFTYIAALGPAIAFIIDIRRQNMLELLIYKALFEMSADRADFLSHLFSRRRPSGLTGTSTAEALFQAYVRVGADAELFGQNRKGIRDRLMKIHQFAITADDLRVIDSVCEAFFYGGPEIDFTFRSSGRGAPASRLRRPHPSSSHTYVSLMTASDGEGKNWSYLASESNFQRVREMQRRNLIVPLVGDFAGQKAIAAVGRYLAQHDAVVRAFYTSNVEEYIRSPLGDYPRFCASVATLPVDATSTFIRWTSGTAARTFLRPMNQFIAAFKQGRPLPYEVRDANGRVLAEISCH